MIKEHIGKEEAAWDTKMYLEVVEEWKRREESPISEEEKAKSHGSTYKKCFRKTGNLM